MSKEKLVSSKKGGEEEDVAIAIPIAVSAVPVVVAETKVNAVQAFQVPGGSRWKNGLFSCCSSGSSCPCPTLMGCCCSPILLGQVVERLKYATRSGDGTSWPICWIFTILWMSAWIIEIIILTTTDYYSAYNTTTGVTSSTDDDSYNYYGYGTNYADAPLYYQILVWVLAVWGWLICIVSCCTRMKMRQQYQLAPLCCGDNCCDDCCITWCCNCCSTIQMARQTHDEEIYEYQMTSRTGLGPGAPEIV